MNRDDSSQGHDSMDRDLDQRLFNTQRQQAPGLRQGSFVSSRRQAAIPFTIPFVSRSSEHHGMHAQRILGLPTNHHEPFEYDSFQHPPIVPNLITYPGQVSNMNSSSAANVSDGRDQSLDGDASSMETGGMDSIAPSAGESQTYNSMAQVDRTRGTYRPSPYLVNYPSRDRAISAVPSVFGTSMRRRDGGRRPVYACSIRGCMFRVQIRTTPRGEGQFRIDISGIFPQAHVGHDVEYDLPPTASAQEEPPDLTGNAYQRERFCTAPNVIQVRLTDRGLAQLRSRVD